LADQWTHEPEEKARAALLRARTALPDDALSSISVVDATGNVRYSTLNERSGKELESLDVSDREYFRVHLQGGAPRVFIGQPLRGRVSGEWVVPFSRPLLENGTLVGVMMVAVSATHLSMNLRDLYPDAADVAALVLDSGRVMAHSGNL